MTEKAIQNAILRAFGTRADMRLWRANTGVAFAGSPSGAGRCVVRFGVPGQADLTGILPRGLRLEIEVKRDGPRPGQLSPAQENYRAMIERFGGVYVLARSVEDVWAAIGEHLRDTR